MRRTELQLPRPQTGDGRSRADKKIPADISVITLLNQNKIREITF